MLVEIAASDTRATIRERVWSDLEFRLKKKKKNEKRRENRTLVILFVAIIFFLFRKHIWDRSIPIAVIKYSLLCAYCCLGRVNDTR